MIIAPITNQPISPQLRKNFEQQSAFIFLNSKNMDMQILFLRLRNHHVNAIKHSRGYDGEHCELIYWLLSSKESGLFSPLADKTRIQKEYSNKCQEHGIVACKEAFK